MYNYCCNNSTRCCGNNINNCCGWYTSPQCRCRYPILSTRQVIPAIPTVPVMSVAYLTNPTATIAATTAIPLSLANIVGSSITANGTGAIVQPGTYKISYSTTATQAAAGDVIVGVTVNGTTQTSLTQTENVAVAANLVNLSASGVITVTAANTPIVLTNLSAAPTTFTNANLVLERIA